MLYFFGKIQPNWDIQDRELVLSSVYGVHAVFRYLELCIQDDLNLIQWSVLMDTASSGVPERKIRPDAYSGH